MSDGSNPSSGSSFPDESPTIVPTEPCGDVVQPDNELASPTLPDGLAASHSVTSGDHCPMPRPLPTLPGYAILGELGHGGMGVVYHAIQRHLHREVALKMVLAGEMACPETRLRFMCEAEAIARLHHPGIVQVYEFGVHEGNLYFTMEFLPGGSLAKKLREGPLAPSEAAGLIQKLGEAAQVAHSRGVVHRDLKPGNVLLTAEGEPKIADFGLAKTAGGSDLTAAGAVLGTPSYMAPEQADGKENCGALVDVYALGAILYECLTGRPPFKAANPIDTLIQVCEQEAVSVRRLNPKVPPDLETICHRCLQKDPAKRYPSAKELAADCARFLAGEPILTRPISRMEKTWRWCQRHPRAAAMAAGTAFLLLGATLVAVLVSISLARQNEQAEAEKRRLEEELRRSRQQVAQLQVAHGLHLIKTGDFFTGLLWLTRPFSTHGSPAKVQK